MEKRRSKRRIQASELTAFLYCARALGYRRAGIPSENQAQMDAGTLAHERLGRAARRTETLIRFLILAIAILGLILALVWASRGGTR